MNEHISDRDPNLQIEEEEFSPDVDSTVLIRERTRGSKLQGTFAKKKAGIVPESKHTINTITILLDKGKPVILSKRDVALNRDKVAKRKKLVMEGNRPHCIKVATGKKVA